MRALLLTAAALALFAAASPTAPRGSGLDGSDALAGRHGRDGPDAATAAGGDAGAAEPLEPRMARPACPPARPAGPHCVYLTLKKPTKAAAERLAKKLRTDGVEADLSEEHALSVALDDARLAKLLGARVSYSLTGAGASDRLVCDAQVASFKPPARYAEVASVRIDAQCP